MIWEYFKPKLPGEIEQRNARLSFCMYIYEDHHDNQLMHVCVCVCVANDKHIMCFTSLTGMSHTLE